MGQALYRKYRSRGFDQVVGQEHVVKTLQNALKSGRISHAYLFTGPRGVGKTSVARILAHEVNGLPYDEETAHLDIIEIDAASNRRIDEIRDLRERVHIAPTSAKYKVYIIDEVHMLTREAFNALLKTLEEPPAHCIFILATTEAHKLPETIISRTQRFNFSAAAPKTAATHLANIAKKEKIDIEPEALELIAEHGGGSFRDSIGLLDQLSGLGDKITKDKAAKFLGLPPSAAITGILRSVEQGNVKHVAKSLAGLREQGVDFAAAAKSLSEQLRQQILDSNTNDWSLKLLRRLSAVGSANNPQAALEIDLLEAASNNQAPTAKVKDPEEPAPAPKPDPPKQPEPEEAEQPEEPAEATEPINLDRESWPEIVDRAKSQAPSLYTALRLAEPRFSNDRLTLAFQFPLHQKKVIQAQNIEILGKIIEEVTGQKVKVDCIVDKALNIKPAKRPAPDAAQQTNESLQAINNIFGSTEMLES